jgi:hypothetical protein
MDAEVYKNPFEDRRVAILAWKKYLVTDTAENEKILEYAEYFSKLKIRNLDSLHLACAVYTLWFFHHNRWWAYQTIFLWRKNAGCQSYWFFESYGGNAMKTDMEIRTEGISVLMKYMGNIEAERFISLIHRDKFEYTKWRKQLFEEKTVREISSEAMKLRNKIMVWLIQMKEIEAEIKWIYRHGV